MRAATAVTATRPVLPLLILLFIGSGCAALIYEVVWFQLLQLIVGSSAISLGVVLGTFMGGMCIGSLALPRFIARHEHPLRVYAKLEAAIALLGILVLVGLPWAGGLYTAIAVHGMPGLFLRALFCVICLLPPTVLMGATLPAIARWVEATPNGVSWLGFFYGGNIAGAVLGCLLAGFYLLREHDTATATFVAVAMNLAVAAAGFALSRATPYDPPADTAPLSRAEARREWRAALRAAWPVYVAVALSGMSALGAEVVWTRLLSLMIGATVYTFSLILAAFLAGLGIGSGVGSFLARSVANPRAALGYCQLLLTLGIAWAAYALTQSLPYWPIDPRLADSPSFTFQIDLVRCLYTILPAAILWGASFPLALAAVMHDTRVAGGEEGMRDPGRLVGTVYAANTVGAIVGSSVMALWVIAWRGTQDAQRILIALAAIGALVALLPASPAATDAPRGARRGARGVVWGVATLGLAAWLIAGVVDIPGRLVAYGRYLPLRQHEQFDVVYMGEGMNSSVAVTQLPNGVLNYHNAGKVQASSEPQDMRLQRMLGHLTTLVPARPTSVLVIGCGAGVTAGAVSIDPAVERVTIAEIEPLVPRVVSTYFGEHNFNVVRNPKVTIEIDDARHFLLTTDQKFDAITSDPLDPWVKGAATLYTREFWELAKEHLNPGGVVTVFVQLYESSPEAVKSEIATFFEAFPNAIVWGNTYNGAGYDLVLLGQVGTTRIDVDAMERRLNDPRYAPMAMSLSEVGFTSVQDLFGTFAAQGAQLRPWLADAQINRDRNLRLQYLAGLGVHKYLQADIYADILRYRRWPEGLFAGSPASLQPLRDAMAGYQ
ncbi:MAG: fused MFS/spermidine synthase [Gemmatimonadaceae bacterium]